MALKKTKKIPFDFVLEQLHKLSPWTRPMFGCTSVYVDDKIMLILREKDYAKQDNGVWVCTQAEHHASLLEELPSMRSIQHFGGETNWQVLPQEASDFEESVIRVCEMICERDPRIGKVPEVKRTKKKKKTEKKKRASRRPRK